MNQILLSEKINLDIWQLIIQILCSRQAIKMKTK